MSLDLERQLTFASNYGPFFELPSWLQIPYLELNLGTFAAITWGGLYLLLEPVAGGALALVCLAAAAGTNYLRLQDPIGTNQISIAVNVVSWIAQFVGHGKFEGRAPALLDNLFQAIFLAPLFVWLELLFMVGYRPELKRRVDKAVKIEIAKFREQQAKKVRKDRVVRITMDAPRCGDY
ncbi:hypothetical protein CHGG_02848 [Chaetomium globosum CBS 148.51]|uniref:DUF962 domain-containing protein n=1 Tax=Chaetomium globosum (strain ATCC 6205 / CBS 148.51 / DSM 1962 / NBRC 6347 / NRRL 1970) TaxID=306901 RepID=Q2HAA6_CHAGB|nr:uncharacterized protein CHGG_02848 [Chaetomium globosum CBS 148.51]EAQ90913.1 hypothetical protein CHGG_02848 [Chaetomium globosum CBS 148.51]